MNKPTLHFYSDCPTFAGCENMLVNFLTSDVLAALYSIDFSYRHSFVYEKAMKQRIQKTSARFLPVRGIYPFRLYANVRYALLRKLLILIDAFLFKYPLFLYNVVRIFFHFKKYTIDILHINNGGYPGAYSCGAAVLAAKLSGVKCIVYVANNTVIPYTHPVRWLDYPVDILIRHAVSKFVTASQYAGRELQHTLSISQEKHMSIPNGIKPRDIIQDRSAFREANGFSSSQVLAAVVANLECRKGHIYLLKALQWIKLQNMPSPIVLIEGVGPEEAYLKKCVFEMGLSDNVRFLGRVQHVFDLMNAVDFVILPSIGYEDFPNVVIEAMGLGRPVVGTDVAGIPEQIVSGETGILIPPKSEEALASSIIRLTKSKVLRESMGTEGYSRFLRFFVKDVAIQNYLGCYQKMLSAL